MKVVEMWCGARGLPHIAGHENCTQGVTALYKFDNVNDVKKS